MIIFQLSAYGNLVTFNDRHTMHSRKVYKDEERAKAAIPDFRKLVTTPKDEQDLMVMNKKNLRIRINQLELIVNNK